MKEHNNKRMIPKFVEVQSDEFETVTTYECEDGTSFDNKADAERYEARLKLGMAEHKEFDGFTEIYGKWYRAKNEDELNFLKNWLADRNPKSGNVSGDEKIKVGEWFTVHTRYNGDSRDEYIFVTLKDMKKEIQDFLDMFE